MILINRSGTDLRPSKPISPGSSIEAVYLSLLHNSTHFATSVAKWVKLLQLYYLHPLECFPFRPTSTHRKVPAADLRQSLQLCSDFTRHCCSARFSLLQRRQHVVQSFFSAYSATPRVSDGELRPQLLRPRSWRAEDHLRGPPSSLCFKEKKKSRDPTHTRPALTRREIEINSNCADALSSLCFS